MNRRNRNKGIAALLLLCMLAAVLAPAALADGLGTGTVTASVLNIRSQASTAGSVVGTLSKGCQVEVTEKTDGWYKISYKGTVGYVSGDYLTLSGDANASSGQSGSINANYVNLRSGASTGNSVVANVSKGTSVTVTATEGDWYKITYNGTDAYVRSDYVTLGDSSTSSSSSTQTGTISGTYVRLRAGASTSSNILKVLDKGASMTVTGTEGDWYKVSYNGTEGYVYKSYLTLAGESSSSSSSSASGQSGSITGSYVRLRSGASTSSNILAVMDKGASVTVNGTEGDWCKVTYNGTDGYVYKSYVSTGSSTSTGSESVTSASGTGTIRGSYVRVRSGASTSSSILATVHTGTTMTITGTTGEWYQVSYNGQTGYVYKSYLVNSSDAQSNTTSAGSTSEGEAIVAKAKEYLGVPYVYGGTSPSGFDCSGLVYYVYKQCGYSIYRTATAQYSNGTYVDRSELQPGDILIFYNSAMTSIGHAGIYIGDNQFIHASSGGGKVQINNLSQTYYNTHYYGARRVVD